jgi:hypothetical protein
MKGDGMKKVKVNINKDPDEIILEEENANPIKRIRILPAAYEKMFHYTKYCKGEVSGFGKTIIGEDEVVIEKIYLLKQVCTSAHTELDLEAHSKFLCSLIRRGYHPKDFSLWWHSHYDFDVFFSGEDEDTISKLSKNGQMFSICINQKGEMTGRMDERGVSVKLPIIITPRNKIMVTNKYRHELKKKVSFEGQIPVEEEIFEGVGNRGTSPIIFPYD